MSDGSSYLSTLILECDVGHAVCLILDIDQDLLVQHQRTDNPTNTHPSVSTWNIGKAKLVLLRCLIRPVFGDWAHQG